MTTATRTHRYLGEIIEPCESAIQGPGTRHLGQWIVRTYHRPSGLPWSDQECPHFPTMADAQLWIRLSQLKPATHD